jgi:hypothetical protein
MKGRGFGFCLLAASLRAAIKSEWLAANPKNSKEGFLWPKQYTLFSQTARIAIDACAHAR